MPLALVSAPIWRWRSRRVAFSVAAAAAAGESAAAVVVVVVVVLSQRMKWDAVSWFRPCAHCSSALVAAAAVAAAAA